MCGEWHMTCQIQEKQLKSKGKQLDKSAQMNIEKYHKGEERK